MEYLLKSLQVVYAGCKSEGQMPFSYLLRLEIVVLLYNSCPAFSQRQIVVFISLNILKSHETQCDCPLSSKPIIFY